MLLPDQDAISVIETDCEVDFAPPLDYVEPQRPDPAAAAAAAAASAAEQRTADGAGMRSPCIRALHDAALPFIQSLLQSRQSQSQLAVEPRFSSTACSAVLAWASASLGRAAETRALDSCFWLAK